MDFDARIIRPKTIDRGRFHHLPVFLTPKGAERMTTRRLAMLRYLTNPGLRFIADSRFAQDGLSGCMLVGHVWKGDDFEFGSWMYAEAVHQILKINVDIECTETLPSLLHNLGRSRITVHH